VRCVARLCAKLGVHLRQVRAVVRPDAVPARRVLGAQNDGSAPERALRGRDGGPGWTSSVAVVGRKNDYPPLTRGPWCC
jgi:hypothetical protein